MGEDFEDVEDEEVTDEQPESETPKKLRNALNRRTKELEDAKKQLAELQRKDVVREAKLDLKPAQLEALLKMNEGVDLTVESLRTTAEDLGFIQPVVDTPASEQEAHERMADAQTGGSQVPPNDIIADINAATTREEVMAAARKGGVASSTDGI